jgi:hypothetical protein
MARTTRRRVDKVVAMPMSESHVQTNQPSESGNDAIARRAYELYCARGCQHGHDIDDWLTAEREVRGAESATTAA